MDTVLYFVHPDNDASASRSHLRGVDPERFPEFVAEWKAQRVADYEAAGWVQSDAAAVLARIAEADEFGDIDGGG